MLKAVVFASIGRFWLSGLLAAVCDALAEAIHTMPLLTRIPCETDTTLKLYSVSCVVVYMALPELEASQLFKYMYIPREGTPILGYGREVLWWWRPFWGFTMRLGPYFEPQHNPIGPLFL